MVIEDNADANETLKDLLELEGHAINCAFDGTAGLAMAKENNYDVIVCDIGLPGIDGFDIVSQLRRQTSKPWPCFIAFTGYDHLESRHRAKEAGFDHYLVKPIATDVLLNLISSSVLQ